MKYPVYKKWAYASLWTADALLSLFFRPKGSPYPPPHRLLLANCGRIGDVILTTSLLPCLKQTYPDVQIGMLVGTPARPVVEDHPLVDWVHTFDHWKITPNNHWRSRKKALREIGALKYDLAVDCRFHFPNTAPLLWQAKIPTRIGFSSAGFGPLLTHPFPWDPKENRSAVEAFRSLLPELRGEPKPTLAISPTDKKESYITIHMGTHAPEKEWEDAKWRQLAESLVSAGYQLRFTGRGEREKRRVERVCAHLPIVDLCDRLDWKAFVSTIQKSALLIGVDSAAGHVAAAVDTPAILLYTGIQQRRVWRPYSERVRSLVPPTESSSCSEISVEQVLRAVFATPIGEHTSPLAQEVLCGAPSQ